MVLLKELSRYIFFLHGNMLQLLIRIASVVSIIHMILLSICDSGCHGEIRKTAIIFGQIKHFILRSDTLLAHLELCSRSAYAMACCPSSICRPLLAFHIFNISSQTISWVELKLSEQHFGSMESQSCQNGSVTISKMATMAANLKFFKQHLLPNGKSD